MFSQISPDMDIFVYRGLKLTHSVLFSLKYPSNFFFVDWTTSLLEKLPQVIPGNFFNSCLLERIRPLKIRLVKNLKESIVDLTLVLIFLKYVPNPQDYHSLVYKSSSSERST